MLCDSQTMSPYFLSYSNFFFSHLSSKLFIAFVRMKCIIVVNIVFSIQYALKTSNNIIPLENKTLHKSIKNLLRKNSSRFAPIFVSNVHNYITKYLLNMFLKLS